MGPSQISACRMGRRGPAAPGEFAAKLEVLAVGLFEGCPEGVDFMAVLLFEVGDLVGQGRDDRIVGSSGVGAGGTGQACARSRSMRLRRSGWP